MEDKLNKEINNYFINQLCDLTIGEYPQSLSKQSDLPYKETSIECEEYVNKIPSTPISSNDLFVNRKMCINSSITSTILEDADIKHVPNLNKPTLGDDWNVYVSQIDSFQYFYVQNTKHLEYIQTISSSLELVSITPKKIPKVGSLIAACDNSGIWYRAKVKRKTKLGIFVCFIDLGDCEVLVTDFKNLPAEFIGINSLAHRCYFKNFLTRDEKFFDSDIFYFIKRFFTMNEVKCIFSNNTEPYSVTLLYNGKNLLDIISELVWDGIVPGLFDDPIHVKKRKMLNKIFSSQKPVNVSVVEPIISTEHFYVETEFSNKIGIKIRTEIEKNKKWVSVVHPEEGKIVIAKNPRDMKLYRARIMLNYESSDKYKCFLIDCGEIEICSELFEPSSYLSTAPPAKIHCSLNASKKYNDSLLKSMTIGFVDEITECNNTPKIMDVIEVGSPCIVDLEIAGLKISKLICPYEVRVVNISNINTFKVRLYTKNMHKIINVLKSTTNVRIVSDPKLFNIYMCKFNNKYKRVKFLGYINSKFDVMFIDELPEFIVIDELYKLPKSIQNIETKDMYCSLALSPQIYSNQKFIDICKNRNPKFMMLVIKTDYVQGHVVKLYLNNLDVETMIC